MAKAILLVIDSFGIGAMEDCGEFSPSDCRANTYKHIRESADFLEIPTLYKLGLGALVDGKEAPANAYGFSALAHHGQTRTSGTRKLPGAARSARIKD